MHRRTIAAALLLAAAVPAVAQPTGSFYDRLSLDTPEAAGRAFALAWRGGDYATCHVILHPATQLAWSQLVATLDLRRTVRRGATIDLAALQDVIPGTQTWEHQDGWWLFHNAMQVIARANLLPIRVPEDGFIAPGGGTADEPRLLTGGDLVLVMARSPAGRWRVRVAMPLDGNAALAPFGH